MYKYCSRFGRFLGILLLQLSGLIGFSQRITNVSLTDKFKTYSEKAIQEKLFLHTDKEFYIAGEIVWFKIYYVEGVSHKPMNMSKLAYAEILNANNEPVLQAKISLEPGGGKGSFYLPATLNTGYYSIRAYTNWMKNFGADYFFEKKITVINTLKTPETAASRDTFNITANFFPEGGNLVNDLRTKLGFMVTSNKGSVNDFRGYIVNQNNDTITSFTPLKSGIGSFYFRPMQGDTYKTMISLPDGSVFNKAFPQAYDYGYVMNVEDIGQQKIKVTVKVKRQPGEQNIEEGVLAVHNRQMLNVAERILINTGDSAVIFVDKAKLGQGITYFTFFNGKGEPKCERLFFTPPAKKDINLTVKTSQPSYNNRQKIDLTINGSQPAGKAAPLNLSVSVFYTDTLQTADQATISDYVWLTSELAGAVESPAYYFSNDVNVKEATDNLMLTQGWRRFRWDNVLDGGNAFIKYMPEINGHIVSGIVKDSRTEKPAAEIGAYLSIPGQPFGFYSSQSDSKGLVFFEVKDFYGNAQIIAQPGLELDSFYRVDILKPYAETTAGKKYDPYVIGPALKEQLLRKSIGMQVQNIYSGDSLRNFYQPYLADTLPFFGAPNMSYKLDDYVRFTTMEEVLREYVREIGVGIKGEKLVFKMFNPIAREFYYGNTLLMMDGVPVSHPDKIFSYDPLKVKKIDVTTDRYVLGNSSFNGIASFTTYNGGFSAFELEPSLVAIDYSGLQLQREFYSPVYETKEQLGRRIPDFRNTLYWSPDIHTNEDGNASVRFYSSDLPGKYVIVIQGMNENGEFVSGTSSFEIK